MARAQVSDATFLGWLTDICSLTLLVKGIICLILWIGAAQGWHEPALSLRCVTGSSVRARAAAARGGACMSGNSRHCL